VDRAGSSFELAREEAKSVPVLLFVSTSVGTMKRGVPRYTRRFLFCGVDYLRCSEGQAAIADLITPTLVGGLWAGCKECLPFGENGSLVGVPGDRKRGTGGRSRTLAPPRGAAWIVDCSSFLLFFLWFGKGREGSGR